MTRGTIIAFSIIAGTVGVSFLYANNCSNPISVTSYPYTYSGTLCGAGDDFPANICSQTGWGASEDMVFALSVQAGATYEISLTVGSGNAGIFLFGECNTVSCYASLTSTGSSASWCWTPDYTGTIYLVVDRDVAGCDNFTLSITQANTPPSEISMYTGTIYTCSATFYDPEGPNCDYAPNTVEQMTICPDVPGQCVQINLNLDIEPGFDFLDVYQGQGCTRVYDYSLTGTGSATILADNSFGDGCVTLVFESDALVQYTGWTGTISCVSCSSSPPSGTTVNMQNGTWITCSGTLYDSGGPFGNYSNNEHSLLTICPDQPGQYVQISFNSFNIEANWDFLYVYDGRGTCGACLGAFTGTTSPGTITSSTPDGCITLEFISDGSVTFPGWQATISCVSTPGTNPVPVGMYCTEPVCLTSTADYTWTSQPVSCGPGFTFPPCPLCNDFAYANWTMFFVFTVATGGTLQFTLSGSPSSTDIDFALWEIPINYDCSDLGRPIRASWDAPPPNTTGLSTSAGDNCECAGGDGFVAAVNATAGTSYLLLVDNFSENGADITLSFAGSTVTFESDPAFCPQPFRLPDLLWARLSAEPEGIHIRYTYRLIELPEDRQYYVVIRRTHPEREEPLVRNPITWQEGRGEILDAEATVPGEYRYLVTLEDDAGNVYIARSLEFYRYEGGAGTLDVSWIPPERLMVRSPESLKEVRIRNMDGRILWRQRFCEVQPPGAQMDLLIPASLSAGVYIVEGLGYSGKIYRARWWKLQ